MLRFRKLLPPLPLLRSAVAEASNPASHTLSSLYLRTFPLSTSAAATRFSVEDYLVAACGLTGAQAVKASTKLSHLKSASKPDAVLAILSGVGLSRADLAAVVAAEPQLLCVRADNLARRIASLRDRVGLTDPQIGSLLLAGGATALRTCDITSRLEFLIPLLGSYEMLLKTVKRSYRILTSDVEEVIKPNFALLQECGLTVCDIVKTNPRLLSFNPERMKRYLHRADMLGVPRCSPAFRMAVCTVACTNEGSVTARMEFLSRTLGCSMDKILVAVGKKPTILGLSMENLRRKIEFLVTKVGLKTQCIVECPVILCYSLEKRVVPRHSVMEILQARGLMKKDASFHSLITCREADFVARYIDTHKDMVPGLADVYNAVCSGKMPVVPESIVEKRYGRHNISCRRKVNIEP
uniref:Mitochondrial transcription termination factor-like family-1 n=1 Tax=Oryza australiensis TaxID=4532 RepID=B9V0G4_9ORYZ|nr:mitochondrial transcription termination factor-like family-1 [Oryza australiensis]